jgi:hypothetical protein
LFVTVDVSKIPSHDPPSSPLGDPALLELEPHAAAALATGTRSKRTVELERRSRREIVCMVWPSERRGYAPGGHPVSLLELATNDLGGVIVSIAV